MWREDWSPWQKALETRDTQLQNHTQDNSRHGQKDARPERQRTGDSGQPRTEQRERHVQEDKSQDIQTSQKVSTKQESSLSPWYDVCLVCAKTPVESPALEINENY